MDRTRKKSVKRYFDYSLLFVTIFIAGFGLIMIYSTSSYTAQMKFGNAQYYFKKQLMFMLLGFAAMYVANRIDYHVWHKLAFPIFICASLLVFALIPFGSEANGATRWIRFGSIGVQPADVMYCIKNYGIVPQEVMPGIMYGDTLPVHNELDAVASGYINAIAKGKLSKLTPVWKNGLAAIYDTYLGKCPENFTYKGKEYTPKTFAESLGLNPDDYVSLTSYTHHPFYSQFAIEIQDNWRNGLSYNLPIDEFMAVMDNAVKKGYTFAWGSDVSEQGFTRDGIAVMPDINKESELSGSDMARWTGLTTANKRQIMTTKPHPEIDVTQEMRQVAFDNWETTDDHGMVIYGIAKDQNGKEYFMVKNSWGKSGKYNGIWYASKAFVAYKTMNILVHKDALPKEIAKKLGIK